jgi:hypothetical protein
MTDNQVRDAKRSLVILPHSFADSPGQSIDER